MTRTIQAHNASVLAIRKIVTTDAKTELLLSVGADGTIAGWDLDDGSVALPAFSLGVALRAATVLPHGQVLAAAVDGRLLSWQPGDLQASKVGRHKDARRLQAVAGEPMALILDGARGVGQWPTERGRVKRLARRRKILLAAAAGPPEPPLEEVVEQPADLFPVAAAALPPLENNQSTLLFVAGEGERVVGIASSGEVQMWELATGRLIGVLTPDGTPGADGSAPPTRPPLIPTFQPPVLTSTSAGEKDSLALTASFSPGESTELARAARNPLANLEEEE